MILAKFTKLAAVASLKSPSSASSAGSTTRDPSRKGDTGFSVSQKNRTLPHAPRRRSGTWVVESTLRDGRSDDKDMQGLWVGVQMTFDGEKVKFSRFPGRTKLYKLDPGWDLKHIDFEFRDVPDGNGWITKLVPSIYRFEGEKLHIVFGVLDLEDRPESFEFVKSGLPFTHISLKRVEPKGQRNKWCPGAETARRSLGDDRGRVERPAREVSGTMLILQSHFTLRPSAEGQQTRRVPDGCGGLSSQIDLKILATVTRRRRKALGIYAHQPRGLALCLDEVGKGRPGFKADNSQ